MRQVENTQSPSETSETSKEQNLLTLFSGPHDKLTVTKLVNPLAPEFPFKF